MTYIHLYYKETNVYVTNNQFYIWDDNNVTWYVEYHTRPPAQSQ